MKVIEKFADKVISRSAYKTIEQVNQKNKKIMQPNKKMC